MQPRQKVVAAAGGSAVATAVATLFIWGLQSAGVVLTPDVTAAISTLFVAAITFAAGYFTPPGGSETSVVSTDGQVRSAIVAGATSANPIIAH